MEYTITAEEGIEIAASHFPQGETVVLSESEANPYLKEKTIKKVRKSRASKDGSAEDEDAEIDTLTGSPVGAVDTSSLVL